MSDLVLAWGVSGQQDSLEFSHASPWLFIRVARICQVCVPSSPCGYIPCKEQRQWQLALPY